MISALIAAAGSGERLGLGPKAWLKLNGKTLFERSIDNLRPFVDEIIVALPNETIIRGVKTILGGKTRQETVLKLLKNAKGDIVIIHDVARPFLSRDIVQNILAEAENGAATTAILPSDSLIFAENNVWKNQLDRNLVRLIQTPQAFKKDLLIKAHEFAVENGISATDDAGLVAIIGHEIRLVPGNSWLFKVTGQQDWQMASYLAKFWDDQSIEIGI